MSCTSIEVTSSCITVIVVDCENVILIVKTVKEVVKK